MGYIRHDAVLVTTYRPDEDVLVKVEQFRANLPEEFRPLLVGPIDGVVNGYVNFAFLPDGSKEGWTESLHGDQYREQFRSIFTDGVNIGMDEVVTVSYGGDYGIEVGATVEAL